jgi:hypothetical protein
MKNLPALKLILPAILTALTLKSFAQAKTDSVMTAVEPAYNKVTGMHKMLLGDNYRLLWATPVRLKVFHIAQEKGGLKIEQLGGGMQTRSLRLIDSTGQEWVLRTIQKYPEKILPVNLRQTIAKDIVQDQISAEHPFAALTVPIMAQALGIPHAHPQVVYVPDDPALGTYRREFANQVFLFEEREPLDASKSDNTIKTQERLHEDNDNRVDEKLFLRARLMDMLLGDWDRHEDQWRWERDKDDTGIYYKPVPRDRDQVYNSSDGLFPWIVSRHLMLAKFQTYKDHIRSINRWNLNGRNVDRYFLNALNQRDWEAEIAYVQSHLTDQVINQAMRQMPDTIYKLSGAKIARLLIARRDILKQQALKYYRFISQIVTVSTSEKREHFDIVNQPDGKVSVTISKSKKDGRLERTIYQRTFDPDVTNDIWLYGMGGPDVFAVHGDSHSPITVRMIGGDTKDSFVIDSAIHGKGNRYIYDIPSQKNDLPKNQATVTITPDTSITNLHPFGFKYNYLQPLILGSYNKDYGVQFVGDFIYQKQGFGKEPYAFRQTLGVDYGFATNALKLTYNGIFKKAVDNNDLVINVLSKGPNYTSNFFGIGNNTVFVNKGNEQIEYYRNIYNYLGADVRLKHFYGKWTVTAGLAAQYYSGDPDDNQDKYLNVYNQQHPGENVFSSQGYMGAVAGVAVDTRDKGILPHDGVYWLTNLAGIQGVNSSSKSFGQIKSEFSFFINPDKDSILVIANRIGGGITIGNAAYFQQLTLGGDQNLRGFYINRFTGKTIAYENFELRLKLADFESYLLPGTLGLVGFNDVGRVWSPGENSGTFHDGYGGGFYFLPAQLILIQGVVGFSREGAYPYISAGFRF